MLSPSPYDLLGQCGLTPCQIDWLLDVLPLSKTMADVTWACVWVRFIDTSPSRPMSEAERDAEASTLLRTAMLIAWRPEGGVQ